MQALDLDYNKLVGITTDGAPSMAGIRSGLVGPVMGKMAFFGFGSATFLSLHITPTEPLCQAAANGTCHEYCEACCQLY